MGSRSSKTSHKEQRELDAKAWSERLSRYFERYGQRPTPARIAILVGAILEDRAVWLAVLMKFGPELDPPFDQAPPKQDSDALRRRRRVQLAAQSPASGSLKEFWFERLKRYYAHYVPDKPTAEIQDLVRRVPAYEWPDVWRAIVATHGPEPIDRGAQVAEAASSSEKLSQASLTATRGSAERVRRASMIARVLTYLRRYDPDVSWEDVVCEVDRHEGNYEALWHLVEERAAAVGSSPTTGPPRVARNEWAMLLCEVNPTLDPFSLDAELDAHENRAGGLSELFDMEITAAERRATRATPRHGEIDRAAFWKRRVTAFLSFVGTALTADEENALWSDSERLGYSVRWLQLVNEYGPEPPHLEAKWKAHREYWVARLATLLRERYPHGDHEGQARVLLNSVRGAVALEEAVRRFAEDVDGEVGREVDEHVLGVSDSLFPEDDAQRAAEREEQRAKLREFYRRHDPSRVKDVDTILNRVRAHAGGFDRMWQLLQLKYAHEIQESELLLSVSTHSVPLKTSSPVQNPAPRHARPIRTNGPSRVVTDGATLWKLRAHVLRAALQVDLSGPQLQERLQCGRDRQVVTQLERDFGPWEPPMLDREFWKWRADRLSAQAVNECPLMAVPEREPDPRLRFSKLRALFRGDFRSAAEAFEEFYRAQETTYERNRRWLKHVTGNSTQVNHVGHRAFWEAKLDSYRLETCPQLPREKMISAIDVGELTEKPYETIWLEFVSKCDAEVRARSAMP